MATGTDEQRKVAGRVLAHWIDNEHRVVTARELARELGCHVDIAKNLMLAQLGASAYRATYLVSGRLRATSKLTTTSLAARDSTDGGGQSLAHLSATQKIRVVDMDERSEGEVDSEYGDDEDVEGGQYGVPGLGTVGNDKGDAVGLGAGAGAGRGEGESVRPEEVGRWGVVLVDQDGLEDKKSLFETCGVHVYALSPARIKDPAQFILPTFALRQRADYLRPESYGTITGEPMGPGAKAPPPGKMRDGAMDWGAGKGKDGKEEKGKAAKPAKEEKKVDDVKAKNEKPAAEVSKAETASSKVAVQEKAKKAEAKVETETAAPTPASSASRKKKRVITSDDEDELVPTAQATAAAPAPISAPLGPTSSMVREEMAAMEAMMGMDMDVDMDDDDDVKPDVAQAASSSKSKAAAGGKKVRQVKKSRKVMDDRGYMVTKDYYTDEEYSGTDDETKPAVKSKAEPKRTASTALVTSNKSGGGGGGGGEGGGGGGGGSAASAKPAPKRAAGQTSLAGFFKKK
ncbi:hypothetical protein Q5752_005705 [Cryptotrichosporon argae]